MALPLARALPDVSRLAFGCMGLGGGWDQSPLTAQDEQHAFAAVEAALQAGINLFDHADIYTFGKAEQVFGRILAAQPELREQIYLQSKCAIRFADNEQVGRYDFSAEYILASVEQSLRRLNTEYLDLLLLHRPDPLMQADEVAAVFEHLHSSGKVRHFGVSNMGWAQLQLLQHSLSQPLLVNQLPLNLAELDWLDEGVLLGNPERRGSHYGYGTLEYCQQQGIQLQSWAPLAQGVFSGASPRNAQQQVTAELVKQLAASYQCSPESIVLAWLLRHPAAIQPVIGSSNPARIAACAQAEQLNLSREHWYQLYVSSRGRPLP
ncbi:aldo/keto reductase [Arsukibacterium sp.]|uniref:aldo/keto reductase n=1 Tax=Arsukibacterium sp. TaxID=1977258 RepID=UPI002FD916DD